MQNFSSKNAQNKFILHSEYKPTGDQPHATAELVDGFKKGNPVTKIRREDEIV